MEINLIFVYNHDMIIEVEKSAELADSKKSIGQIYQQYTNRF
mgnify:CR=1 FL=1